MKVFVTGATGFLGSHVVQQLKTEGHDVRALARKTSDTRLLRELDVEIVEGSVSDDRALRRAVEGVDAVVHSAGATKVRRLQEFEEINGDGTRRLVAAVLDAAPSVRRFVYVSSMAAMGGNDGERPVRADDEPRPPTAYGQSKLSGERHALAAKDRIPVTVFRPTGIYGPRDTELFKQFLSIKRGLAASHGDGKSVVSLVYGPDCADAIIKAIQVDHPSGRVYLISDGQPYTMDEMLDVFGDAVGRRGLRVRFPYAVLSAVFRANELVGALTRQPTMLRADKVNEVRTRNWHLDISPLREELGWEPRTPLREGTRITYEWYRREGWL
ncbi:MAG: NAD-dependent epimerase/dehydratase family protein [Deltaproteobacteria bacterium]|nr:NAD-dependent epimerase/dehydratase family protein [Deltaproteobacteria bacterium]